MGQVQEGIVIGKKKKTPEISGVFLAVQQLIPQASKASCPPVGL